MHVKSPLEFSLGGSVEQTPNGYLGAPTGVQPNYISIVGYISETFIYSFIATSSLFHSYPYRWYHNESKPSRVCKGLRVCSHSRERERDGYFDTVSRGLNY